MRHAAICLSALVLAASGCGGTRECKKGTLLVEAHYPAGVEKISISVSLDGGADTTGVLENPNGATVGSAEVDFNTYPAGAQVKVSLRAFVGGTVIAGRSQTIPLATTCTKLTLSLDDTELDGSVDGPIGEDQGVDQGPSCVSGKHYCAGAIAACVDDTSLDSCGTSCAPCAMPAMGTGTATCTMGACGVTCAAGFAPAGSTCDVAPPRPIAPGSNTYTSDARPSFEWVLAADTDGAHLDVCTDRACTTKVYSTDVSGSTHTPPANLGATGTLFWRVSGHTGTVTGSTFSPVWEFQPLKHASAIAVKTSFGRLSDINNDGYADVVVSDDAVYPVVPTNKGSFYVHYGSSGGAATSSTTTITGGALGGGFGSSVALLGDVNGDGYADLLVGSYNEGKAYFYPGGSTGLVTASPTVLASAASGGNAEFGRRVAAAGDLNGDGYADAVVGASNTAQGAYVFYGGSAGLKTTPSVSLTIPVAATWFGSVIAGAGDVNRDGYADLLVGDPGTDTAYLYFGGPTGVSATATQIIASPVAAGQRFAEAVGGAGDVNGDGYADVVISSVTSKQAWIFKGLMTGLMATADKTVPASAGPASYGQSVDCVGDLNGDGYTDLVVTVLNSTTQYFYLGSGGGLLTAGVAVTAPANAGSQGTGAGDVNGDGFSDALIGVPSGTAGSFSVYHGAASVPTTPTSTLTDSGVTGRYGVSVQ